MTDNEIIKALEHCHKISFKNYPCENCPLINEECFGGKVLMKRAVDLINRQKAEIDDSKAQVDFVISSKKLTEAENNTLKAELELSKAFYKEAIAERDLLNLQLVKATAEIERLKHLEKNVYEAVEELTNKIKAEAVKEFAERLKDMSEHFWEEKENFVSEEQIDNLLKELVGEDNVD